jgi:hypothetical protein
MFPNEAPYEYFETERTVRPRSRDDELSFNDAVVIDPSEVPDDACTDEDLSYWMLDLSTCTIIGSGDEKVPCHSVACTPLV